MEQGEHSEVYRRIQTLFHEGTAVGLTDGQLLERFIVRRDEGAFTALVERHGPMVLRVCRRVLGDADDADDAFQATFLVLARKASAIRRRCSVGSWLYGTALRIAADARAVAARRRVQERKAADMRAMSVSDDPNDLGAVVHEELGRLPERYRAAVVLCYLEGRSCEEAARELNWPIGTVKSRLARARERLRNRLIRRGVTSPGAVGAVLSVELSKTPPAVPTALGESTIRATLQLTWGKAMTGVVSASVITLTEGALRTMFLTKLKIGAVAALVVGSLAVGTGVLAQQGSSQDRRNSGRLEMAAAITESQPDVGTISSRSAISDIAVAERPPARELQVRIAAAQRRLNATKRLHQQRVIGDDEVAGAQAEVDILRAQLEAQREDFQDEMELLEARLRVKESELDQANVRTAWLRLDAGGSGGRVDANQRRGESKVAEVAIRIKEAEIQEIEVRIKHVKRRLRSVEELTRPADNQKPSTAAPVAP